MGRATQGVEAFVEPRTTVTQTTVVLVAHDGEWTRRRVENEAAAFDFGKRTGIPVYEVTKVGYPQRMRDYTARQKRGEVDAIEGDVRASPVEAVLAFDLGHAQAVRVVPLAAAPGAGLGVSSSSRQPRMDSSSAK